MRGISAEEITAAEAEAFLTAANANVLIVGHTHRPFEVVTRDGRRILNPGALLRSPAEGAPNPPATGTFGVLELPSLRFRVMRAGDGAEVRRTEGFQASMDALRRWPRGSLAWSVEAGLTCEGRLPSC